MNTTTLQKCVDELKKDAPNIPYILGMLETFIEMSPSKDGIAGAGISFTPDPRFQINSSVDKRKETEPKADEMTDEEKRIAQAYERGQTGKIT